MTIQDMVKALRICGDMAASTCTGCPMENEPPGCGLKLDGYAADALESMAAELEQFKKERDAWQLRAEAAERDIISMLGSCDCETRHEYCARSCPPNECSADECAGYAKWRGPCAENGGVENG